MSGLAYRRVWVLTFVLLCSVLVGDANGKPVRVKVAVRSHVKSGHHFEEVRIW